MTTGWSWAVLIGVTSFFKSKIHLHLEGPAPSEFRGGFLNLYKVEESILDIKASMNIKLIKLLSSHNF